MLDSIPIAVKNKILSIVSHPKFSELIHNWNDLKDISRLIRSIANI
jgi:hypothetical protein